MTLREKAEELEKSIRPLVAHPKNGNAEIVLAYLEAALLAVREEAIEECASVADEHAKDELYVAEHEDLEIRANDFFCYSSAAAVVANKIRALKEKK